MPWTHHASIELRQAPALLAAVLLFTLAGCSSIERTLPPDVSLADLKLTDVTVFETTGKLVVRISNENPEPMVIDGAAYSLYLDGRRIGKALSDARLEIPRLGSATDEIELHISNLALATRIRSVMESKVLDYRIKGKVYVEKSYGTRRVSVSKEGTFDFEKAASGP